MNPFALFEQYAEFQRLIWRMFFEAPHCLIDFPLCLYSPKAASRPFRSAWTIGEPIQAIVGQIFEAEPIPHVRLEEDPYSDTNVVPFEGKKS